MGRNILRRMGHPQPQLTEADEALLAKQRGMLLAARDKRVRPQRDDKRAGRLERAGDFRARPGRRRVRAAPTGSQAAITAFDYVVEASGRWRPALSLLPMAASAAPRALPTITPRWRAPRCIFGKSPARRASSTRPSAGSRTLERHFWNSEKGGYCITADDAEPLIVRARMMYRPGRSPSANGTMI